MSTSRFFPLVLLLAFLATALPATAVSKGAFMRVSPLKAGHSNRIEANNNPVMFRDPEGLSPNLGNIADDYYRRGPYVHHRAHQSWMTVLKRTYAWMNGIPTKTFYNEDDDEIYDLMYSPGVDKARKAFYKKNSSCQNSPQDWVEGSASFGPLRFIDATVTNNATRHYIGSFEIEIFPMANGDVRFVVTDTKSLPSLLYHIPGVPEEKTPGMPFWNQTSTYTWTEGGNYSE